MWSFNSTTTYLSKKNYDTNSERYMYYVKYSIIYNSQDRSTLHH